VVSPTCASYTTITDTAPPGEIIPLLNDYAEAVITAITKRGGDVLKLIGDGTLALFRADDPSEACRRALKAEEILRGRVKDLNEKRRAEERPVTSVYIGLHVGEVFYRQYRPASIGSISRSWAPQSTRPAASPRCAARSTGHC